jgi:hypothetical protein
MTNSQGTEVETPEESRNPAVLSGDQGRPATRPKATLEQLLVRFSQPSSQISGRIVGLFGTLLVIATLVLGLIHMLGAVDFVATMATGAVLSIAGVWAITMDYNRAQRAAEEFSAGK